jgi:hypothetical protein
VAKRKNRGVEHCEVCGCLLHRDGDYGLPTVKGRSHATEHHFVAERFYGRSSNRRGTKREGLFDVCPWGLEGQGIVLCYECHEELIHNPVFLPEDIANLQRLVQLRDLAETGKSEDRSRIAGRVRLLNEALALGLRELVEQELKQVVA